VTRTATIVELRRAQRDDAALTRDDSPRDEGSRCRSGEIGWWFVDGGSWLASNQLRSDARQIGAAAAMDNTLLRRAEAFGRHYRVDAMTLLSLAGDGLLGQPAVRAGVSRSETTRSPERWRRAMARDPRL